MHRFGAYALGLDQVLQQLTAALRPAPALAASQRAASGSCARFRAGSLGQGLVANPDSRAGTG